MLNEQYVTQFDKNEAAIDGTYIESPSKIPTQIHSSPGARMSHTYKSPFEIPDRMKDYSTFASEQQTNSRRFFFFGDYEVGKTSLWLRYLYYDQKRADISVDQTPNRDGYIFEKNLADGYTNYKIQAWDFLTPLEAR